MTLRIPRAVPPEDLTPRRTVHVKGNALTSVTQAFESGFRAALAGKSIDSCGFRNPLFVVAFERGYCEFQRKMKEIKK